MKTIVAQCAAAIRQELKQHYPVTKFSVRSDIYSMGDHVNVEWTDGASEKEVEQLLAKYQYGHFDGMVDMYEYSNSRDDIPQTKYLFCKRNASTERVQKAVSWLNANTDVKCSLGQHGEIEGSFCKEWNEWPSTIVHRMLSGFYTRTNPEMDFSLV